MKKKKCPDCSQSLSPHAFDVRADGELRSICTTCMRRRTHPNERKIQPATKEGQPLPKIVREAQNKPLDKQEYTRGGKR